MIGYRGCSAHTVPIRRPVTSVTCHSGAVSGTCDVACLPFDRTPSLHALRRRSSRVCSSASSVLWVRPTPRLFPDSFVSSTSCRGPGPLWRWRARRGLPGSGAFPSDMIWSFRPRQSDGVSRNGAAHVAFDVIHRLGLCDVDNFVAQYRPYRIAVYASPWSSPPTPQHSLPSARYSLLGPDLHRLERASFSWRTD